ncbi:MAG: CDP-diacylglycerol--serine O-phosphatidyltransferase [Desulfitobacteriia bacterium]
MLDTRTLPCLITLANLMFGFLAIIYALNHSGRTAAAMILLAVLMDSLDGKVARKFKADSDFGKELDSLSDMVSFGLAPAVLVYIFVFLPQWPFWGIGVCAFFIMCGAVRLARFNILCSSGHFTGVPITFAGGFMALMLLFHDNIPWTVYPAVMLILAFLMISSLQVPKLGR